MLQSSGFIAAIDFGTSQIRGIIGRRNENNVVSVLACESLPSGGCIRRGTIYNIEESAGKVRKLINLLENSIGKKIGKVYVALNGQSIHTEEIYERKQLSSSGIVTEETIRQLRETAKSYKPDFQSKYVIADVEYFLDEKSEQNPVGVTCSVIEAAFQMVVGRPNLAANIEKVIKDKAHVEIAEFIAGPIAAAEIALTKEEKELGCAFIDFGAGTTTVSVYKNGILRRMVVIPFGGKNITKDIAELNFVETDAEQFKIKFGKAKTGNENSSMFSSPFSSPFVAKPEIDLEELNKVILLRLDEIVANAKEQIKQSGYAEQLGAGLIITGGASQLRNMEVYLQSKFDMPVRKASARKNMVNNFPELSNDPAMTLLLGLLLQGSDDCAFSAKPVDEEMEDTESKAANRSGSNFKTLRDQVSKRRKREKDPSSSGKNPLDFFGKIFGADDDEAL